MNRIVPEKINMAIKTKEEIEDEENELQVQRSLEEDMVKDELLYDEHKENCNGCALCEI